VFIRVSLGLPVPEPVGLLIPATAALVHANTVPVVALVGVYENTVPLQIAGGVSVLVRVGIGFTVTTNWKVAPVQLSPIGVTV
jgi:hypothetical protein